MNIKNRTLFIADNLDIMRGMNSDTIELIYLDPPFNSNRNYKAPIGSPAEGATFKDIWTDEDIKAEWHGQIAAEHEELYQIIQASEVVYDKSMKIYLTAMAVRFFEMKRILKRTGSIYLHCDPTANHYLKMVMDSLFGKQNFRNEIVWKRRTMLFQESTETLQISCFSIRKVINITGINNMAHDLNPLKKSFDIKMIKDEYTVLTISQHLAQIPIECLNGKVQSHIEIGHIPKKNLMKCCPMVIFGYEKMVLYPHHGDGKSFLKTH